MNHKQLQALKETWYAKLKKSGFKDIERRSGAMQPALPRSRALKDSTSFEVVQAYYNMTDCFLNEHEFENNFERTIWTYYAEGISIRNMIKLFHKAKITRHKRRKIDRNTVWAIVKKFEKQMKEKYLKP